MPRPRMLFHTFAQAVPSHHFEGYWATPQGQAAPYSELRTWIEIARTIEAAKFDGFFLADTLGLLGPFGDTFRVHAESGMCFPSDDAILICTALAAVTENLGLGFTSSLIQTHPFELAHLSSTLDRLTGGRAGWNIVTSSLENSFRNFGFTRMPTHDERYARVDEYLEVVLSLWEGSWAMDAVVKDPERRLYADPTKVFRINHEGPLFSVQGPHISEPSPQRTPFLFTAGMSDSALRVAAQHAEAVLIMARDPHQAREFVDKVDRMLVEHGRRPGDCKVLQIMRFVVGSTEQEALTRYDELVSWMGPHGALIEAGGVMGFDLGRYGIDEEIDITEANGFKGIFGQAGLGVKRTTTPRQIAEHHNIRPTIGTPEQIADVIETWQDAGVAGIHVADYLFHGSFVDFCEQVMPELQKRGIAQKEYAPGTYREKVFGEGPHLPDRHPAARYRGAFTDAIG